MGRLGLKYTVGEVAKLLRINASTLRYYDEQGIVKPNCVSNAGYRLYTSDDIRRLELVLALRSTGLSLHEISKALSEPMTVDKVLKNHLSYIEDQIERLQKSRSILETTMDASIREKNDDVLLTLREVAHILELSDEDQQQYLLQHIQTLLHMLVPGRDPLTQGELSKLREYLFGVPQVASNEGSFNSIKDKPAVRTDALIRAKWLAEHPEEVSDFMSHIQPLIDRLKSMPEPETPEKIRDTMNRFRDDIYQLMLEGETPNGVKVQKYVDEYVAVTAKWLYMTIEEYKQWARNLYSDFSGSELVQALTHMMTLNEDRIRKDGVLKDFLREAFDVWRRNNL